MPDDSVKGSPPLSEDRRRFLVRGALGGALLFFGGAAGLAVWPTREVVAPPTAPLASLSPRTFQVLAAIARRVVVSPEADPRVIALHVDRALSCVSDEAREDLNKLLLLFENALPGLIDFHLRPFTQLDASSQDAVLDGWRDSVILLRRTGYHALRKLCLAAWYAQPAAWPHTGYPGPPSFGGFVHDDSRAGVVTAAAVIEGARP